MTSSCGNLGCRDDNLRFHPITTKLLSWKLSFLVVVLVFDFHKMVTKSEAAWLRLVSARVHYLIRFYFSSSDSGTVDVKVADISVEINVTDRSDPAAGKAPKH